MTETQIAEENMKTYYKYSENSAETPHYIIDVASMRNKTHKASCQRFLEFLEEVYSRHLEEEREHRNIDCQTCKLIQGEITDLEQAIKLYDEAGI